MVGTRGDSRVGCSRGVSRGIRSAGRGRSLARGLITAALLALPFGAQPASAAVKVEAEPRLVPEFSSKVTDYAVACEGKRLSVAVKTGSRARVGVDGSKPRSGRFDQRVPLGYGQRFEIEVRRGRRADTHHVRCLPEGYPDYEFTRYRPPARSLYATSPDIFAADDVPGYAALIDDRGTPLWWYGRKPPVLPGDVQVLSDGTIAFSDLPLPDHSAGRDGYQIRTVDGKLERVVSTVGSDTDPHEMIELGGGRFLVQTYRPRQGVDLSEYGGPANATIVDSEIQRINRRGEVAWSWSSKDHIDLDESAPRWTLTPLNTEQWQGFEDVFDPTHLNSIETDGKDLIISMRHTDAVYKISGGDGHVIWKLGGTETPESLEVNGDPESPGIFGGQHDARLLRPGVITIHDNGTDRDYAPRALRFEIDEQNGIARLIDAVTDPQAPASFCCGSARRIDGGYWVLGWGGVLFSTEFDPQGRRTFKLDTPGLFSYRTVPVGEGLVSDRELRVGMDAQYPRQPPECSRSLRPGPSGTLEADRLRGRSHDEYIAGLAAEDRIRGRGGDDCLLGDAGADRLVGGPGDDQLIGGPGADDLGCGGGRDTVVVKGRDSVGTDCERVVRR